MQAISSVSCQLSVVSCQLSAVSFSVSGDCSGGETPVPIPNTVVKPSSADDTAWETVWESRSLPGFLSPLKRGLFLLGCQLSAGIIQRFSSRSGEGADLTRRATGGRRKRTPCSTLRRPSKRNAVRSDDFAAAVENFRIVPAYILLKPLNTSSIPTRNTMGRP